MKHVSIILIFVLILSAPSVHGKKWIVNNNIPVQPRDFADVQVANDAPATANGDTLYVVGSPVAYLAATISKSFVIVGNGYFHGGANANPNTPLNQNSSYINSLELDADNITVMGVTSYSIRFGSSNTNVRLTRCFITNSLILGYYNVPNIKLYINSCSIASLSIGDGNEVEYLEIRNNYIAQGMLLIGPHGGWVNFKNAAIYNNIVFGNITIGSIYFNLQIYNNIIYGQVNLANGILNNNLMMPGSSIGDFSGSNSSNNLCSDTQLAATFGNQQNVANVSTAGVFKGAAGNSADGQWQLRAGSPAIVAGQSGAECGMFGNVSPYVLSGVPPIPTVQAFTFPGTGTTSLPIQATIRSRN